jgi:hypothetical protein
MILQDMDSYAVQYPSIIFLLLHLDWRDTVKLSHRNIGNMQLRIGPRDDDGTKDPSTFVDIARALVRSQIVFPRSELSHTHMTSSLQPA